MTDDDPIVTVLPIHLSTALAPNVHLHQFPLLTRPLQVPPSAAQSGKKIRARLKPKAARLEIHVPVDSRKEVWNRERSEDMGKARAIDDAENSAGKRKANDDADQRLSDIRLRSEQVPDRGAYMLGIVRDGMDVLFPLILPFSQYSRSTAPSPNRADPSTKAIADLHGRPHPQV